MTVRLSISSLAGILRTLVAVGTASEASMLVTTRAAGPRSTWASASSATVVGAVGAAGAGGGTAGTGCTGTGAGSMWTAAASGGGVGTADGPPASPGR